MLTFAFKLFFARLLFFLLPDLYKILRIVNTAPPTPNMDSLSIGNHAATGPRKRLLFASLLWAFDAAAAGHYAKTFNRT